MTAKDYNALHTVDIEGPNGIFTIAFAGSTPDGFCFFYKDQSREFFFYAEINTKPIWTVLVQSASTGKWSGRPVKLNILEQKLIEDNISFFFKTRIDTFPDRKAGPDEAAKIITFSWGFER